VGDSRYLFESQVRGGREALESSRRRAGLISVYLGRTLLTPICSTHTVCLSSFFFASLTICS